MFLQVYVIALALAFSRFAFASEPDCFKTYGVQEGDTCITISQKENVPTIQVSGANPSIDENCFNLKVGQVICLGYKSQYCSITVIVKSGDTCESIAAAHSLTVTVLRTNNQLDDDCDIYVGEVLCVSPTAIYGLPSGPSESTPGTKTALPSPFVPNKSGGSSPTSESAPPIGTSEGASPNGPISKSKSAPPLLGTPSTTSAFDSGSSSFDSGSSFSASGSFSGSSSSPSSSSTGKSKKSTGTRPWPTSRVFYFMTPLLLFISNNCVSVLIL